MLFCFCSDLKKNAFVAQWIEHLVAVQRVAGSIPAERTHVVLIVLVV